MERVLDDNYSPSFQWLSRFWAGGQSGFHRHSTWTKGGGMPGATDSLVLALLDAEPSIVTTSSNKAVLVDPGIHRHRSFVK